MIHPLMLTLAILVLTPVAIFRRLLVIHEPSLQSPLVANIIICLVVGLLLMAVFSSFWLRRFLAWPLALMMTVILNGSRLSHSLFEDLLGPLCELTAIVIFAISETLVIANREKLAQFRASWLYCRIALLLMILSVSKVSPANNVWQQWFPLACMALILISSLPDLPVKRMIPAISFPRIRLPDLHLNPFIRSSLRQTHETGEKLVPVRPMLSLDRGYLVRHQGIAQDGFGSG